MEKQEHKPEFAPFIREDHFEKNDKEKPHKDVACGFGIFKGPFLQRFATEKMYVLIYGLGGCLLSMSLAYFSGTITTMEKRYKIPTKMSGVILVGNDISMMITSVVAGYYTHRAHRPRWIAFGFFTIVVFCVMTSSLHFIYGPGEDSLKLTREYGGFQNLTSNGTNIQTAQKLCMKEEPGCIVEDGIWVPQVMLFAGQFISGIGVGLFWSVGVAYMDDNTSKAKSPALLSATAFLRMLGPAIGYSLASVCLRMYIDPSLEPLIKPGDPRWIGAWWLGWLVLAAVTFIIAFLMFLFPKELPSSKARRLKMELAGEHDPNAHKDLSVADMLKSVNRLCRNKVFMYNTFASSFYLFGYLAYWIFTPKYIETQYRQSAATATLATGSVALTFSAIGVLLSGYVVSKYKPSARSMAAWNAIVDFLTVAAVVGYIFIGCEGSDQLSSMATTGDSCSASCHCEYVHYAPICSPNNVTYISACHAGCTGRGKDTLGRPLFTGCSCIAASNTTEYDLSHLQTAVDGACPVDCTKQFYIFLAAMCFLKLIGASSKSTNVLITLRCILPADKSLAMGLTGMAACLTALIPSPIFFGWLLDKYCLVWGKTCSNKGNCWLYDTQSLRYTFNLVSAFFIFFGGVLNIAVWLNAKDLKVFDEVTQEKEKPDGNYDDYSKLSITDVIKAPVEQPLEEL
ncbi:solute carrier organic anion transporter family member 74D-like isoform X1 [Drosophila nasuta]|uniref:solute carrier organic anion transporter family member 74D-like isoform X1 n=1 Tax=Drosophila nasuta TaxID=42062 RepID=UPI00295EFCD3|nr:solute carrier organic anion transporter family member 74D-like isoform X1 [Drosophila nasuta]XP_060654709.1 solute carrier organic anion transporter family member 74D-like isoform X1 [Drosophila nasuta]XP_060654710.1 solute carrier organic anion transporter family member 74D-like isoform X1 [Drosophila nasuta]